MFPKTKHWKGVKIWAAFVCLSAVAYAESSEFRLESAGARVGFPANHSGSDFNQAEGFVNWNLPWNPALGLHCNLQLRLDLSAGWIGETRGVDAAIFTLGNTLVLRRDRFPVSLTGGISPTFLTENEFVNKDFGIPLQFTTHIGVDWDVTSHVRLGYHFQHMSNGGLSHHNPGLNLHMIGLSYVF